MFSNFGKIKNYLIYAILEFVNRIIESTDNGQVSIGSLSNWNAHKISA